jgi:hypothetical protein
VGDAIRLFIEPQRQCRLTLINIDDDGDSCVMFPHPDLDDKPIAAGSTFVFPPKGSLRFSEVGVETVIAVCNFSRAAISAELRDTSKVSCDKSQLVYAGTKIEDDAILDASDDAMMKFAKQHLNYNHNKGLDFVARFNKKYVIGEAKFLSDFGGHQNAQFNDAISTIQSKDVKAIKIAILDGVLFIKGGNKMHKSITETYKDYNIMSSLVLREFLYQL